MAKTIYAMKEQAAEMNTEIESIRDNVATMLMDNTVKLDTINAEKKRAEDIEARAKMLAEAITNEEAKQRVQMKQQTLHKGDETDPVKLAQMNRGKFYRAALLGGDVQSVAKMAFSSLGAIPADNADLGSGNNLLPVNLSKELITDPAVTNPMRAACHVTNIRNYQEPRITFTIEAADYDNITDLLTSKEIASAGDMVTYGRYKVKVKAKVADTVLLQSDYDLAGAIESALRSGLAVNEMARMGAASPTGDYIHMSAFATDGATPAVPLIAHATGTDKITAIYAALAALPIAYANRASIAMSRADWFGLRSTLLNGAQSQFANVPLEIGGVKVVLMDYFAMPVVGDFAFLGINYDIGTVYDQDKDVDSGIYSFVLTAWYDIQWRMRAAFRIAEVVEEGA